MRYPGLMEYQGLFLVVLLIIKSVKSCPTKQCTTRTTTLPPMNILNRNGKSLQTTAISIEIKVPKSLSEGCIVNTANYVEKFKLSNESETVIVFSFRCHKVHPIFLTEYKSDYVENSFGYLQVRYCILGHYDVKQIFPITNMLVVTMFESLFDPQKPSCLNYSKSSSNCSGLENMSSLAFTPPPNYSNSNLMELFNCSYAVFHTYELSLSSQGIKELPEYFKHKFPNVQTLELEKNNLVVPPNFPWSNEVRSLDYNLSRSVYFSHHYASPFHVNLPDNVFRRYLNLNFNKITDLRKFQFRGELDMISIKYNRLEYINEYTFTNIRGLQSLDLSENLLRNIPLGSFRALTDLHNLNLRNNSLLLLHKDIFDDLKNLIKLDLSLNELPYLPEDIFTRLESLKILNLDSNRLTHVPTESFPVLSVNLQEIHMNFNPISSFPVVVFYLRYLKVANLKYTHISLNNVSGILSNISFTYLGESITESAASNNINFEREGSNRLRVIDLTGSNVSTIGYTKDKFESRLELILKHFKFILNRNDLFCDCKIIPFSKWVHSKIPTDKFTGNEYFFKDWKCQTPIELFDRNLLGVAEEETYCEVEVALCPTQCKCYKWSVTNVITVDCRNRSLVSLPDQLPEGVIDLWFQNNNITRLQNKDYFERTRDVIVSHNAIAILGDNIINSFTDNLRKLDLSSNYLTGLPKSIQAISDVKMYFKDNPFVCDCRTLWMKSWILKNQHLISDWIDLACAYGKDEGDQFISVDDDKFVCLEAFDAVKHVIAPSVSSSIFVLLFLTMLGLSYIFRLELKVLIFIYFGFHPFDKDEKDEDEDLDCVIIHSKLLTDWVMENIVAPLEADDKAYVVCEISRDFVVGFSYQENIYSFVRRSKRMILILSEELLIDTDLVKIAWNEAQEKIKDMRTNYAVVVCHEISMKMIDNKDLKRYIKRGRYITTHDKLFFEKILYSMPQLVKNQNRKLPNLRKIVLDMYENEDNVNDEKVHAFLTYSERDIRLAIKTLIPILQEKKYALHVPDRDFIPGASKEENILKAIDICRHTIFLLSGPYLDDEWSLFTFRTASEKSIRQKCNHMIVVIIDGHENAFVDEEIKYYLRTHVTLHITDKWFWQKLLNALPNNRDVHINNEQHHRDLLVNNENEIHIHENLQNQNRLIYNKDNAKLQNGVAVTRC